MAKKKDKEKTLLIAVLLGVGFYLLTRRKPTTLPPTYQNFQQIPTAPPAGTPAWTLWVQSIVSVFGTMAALWQPGGPFYKQPLTETQAIEISKGGDYSDYA